MPFFIGEAPYGTVGGADNPALPQTPADIRLAEGRGVLLFLRVNGPLTQQERVQIEDVVRILGLDGENTGLPEDAIAFADNGAIFDDNVGSVDFGAGLEAVGYGGNVVVIAIDGVTAGMIASGAITAGKIAAGAVESVAIAAGAVTTGKIDALAVIDATIDDGAVTAGKIVDGSVTTAKIGADQVVAGKIAAGAVVTPIIVNSAVGSAELDTGAVTTGKLANLAVTTLKIPDNAIVTAKIGDGQVMTGNVADGAITPAKLDRAFELASAAPVTRRYYARYSDSGLSAKGDFSTDTTMFTVTDLSLVIPNDTDYDVYLHVWADARWVSGGNTRHLEAAIFQGVGTSIRLDNKSAAVPGDRPPLTTGSNEWSGLYDMVWATGQRNKTVSARARMVSTGGPSWRWWSVAGMLVAVPQNR